MSSRLMNESSTNSSNVSQPKKNGIILSICLLSLLLNIVVVICLMSSRSSVKSLTSDLGTKDSLLNLAKQQIISLEALKTQSFRDTIILDVDSFVNNGLLKTYTNTKDSATRYNYTFQVLSRDTVCIYRDGEQIFRNSIEKLKGLENVDKMCKLFADFNEKLQQYLNSQPPSNESTTQQNLRNTRGKRGK